MVAPRYVPRHLRSGEESAHAIERDTLGEKRVDVDWSKSYNKKETRRLQAGVIAMTTEDRWEAVWDDDDSLLSLYRSWSGTCMFVVELIATDKGSQVGNVWMNADSSQMRVSADQAADIIARLMGELADGSVQTQRKQAVEDVEEPSVRTGRFARNDSEESEEHTAVQLLASIQSSDTDATVVIASDDIAVAQPVALDNHTTEA